MKTLKTILLVGALTLFGMVTYAQQKTHVFSQIASANTSSYFIRDDSTLWSAGWNADGELGVPEAGERTGVIQLMSHDHDWVFAAGGRSAAFFIKNDGSMWAVGSNEKSLQGTGNELRKNKVLTRIGEDNDWKYVTASRFWGYNGFAIKTDGTLWGWGDNESGILDPDKKAKTTPVQIGSDNDWLKVASGQGTILAIKTDGSLWAWGSNMTGSLGLGIKDNTVVMKPTRVGSDNDWIDISCVELRSYAKKKDGTWYSAGYNDGRNLLGFKGYSPEGEFDTFNEFKKLDLIDQPIIFIGGYGETTMIGVGEGDEITQIFGWGSLADYALGNGKGYLFGSTKVLPPVTVPTSPSIKSGIRFKQMATGLAFTIVLDENGKAYGWGSNRGGMLVDGTSDPEELKTSVFKKPTEIECPQDKVNVSVSNIVSSDLFRIEGLSIMIGDKVDLLNIYSGDGRILYRASGLNSGDILNFSNMKHDILIIKAVSNEQSQVEKVIL
ncbi:RCC1 domain-containing protein [Falsiporphyromonas endometrii]|uniref:RCC1 domain-containing protein n=1 Tax=Falsiporphyromonas endometrii TaxID=1387297 RepID=A0ABV9K694_9PORP